MVHETMLAITGCRFSWPASYHGRGIRIERVPDGGYVGRVEGGYRSAPYADVCEALADITTWIDHQEGCVSDL